MLNISGRSEMPKDTRIPCSSLNKLRASPYHHSPKNSRQFRLGNPEGSAEDVKEWEKARCPICMEPPHNAVLLRCSSYENGCHPYMCDTSYRHSNCLDQFSKTGGSQSDSDSHWRREESVLPGQTRFLGRPMQSQLTCPLCRGQVYGIVVIDPAREYMNSKQRSCSCETCEFTGTYSELRKHARSEHPAIVPSDVDPTRQDDWSRLERETEIRDLLSMVGPSFAEGENGEGGALPLYTVDSFVSLGPLRILSLLEIMLSYMEHFPWSSFYASARTGGMQHNSSLEEMFEDTFVVDADDVENDPESARVTYENETHPRARGRFDRNTHPTTGRRIDDRRNPPTPAWAWAQQRNGIGIHQARGRVRTYSRTSPAVPTRRHYTGRQANERREMEETPRGIARFRYGGWRSRENMPHFGQQYRQNRRG